MEGYTSNIKMVPFLDRAPQYTVVLHTKGVPQGREKDNTSNAVSDTICFPSWCLPLEEYCHS